MAKAKPVKKLSKGEVLVAALAVLAKTTSTNQESDVIAASKKLVSYVKSLEKIKAAKAAPAPAAS